jgi:hypothetical protein
VTGGRLTAQPVSEIVDRRISRSYTRATTTTSASRKPISVTAAATLVSGAVALWVSFGSLAFLDTTNRAPYVGILPSPFWLFVLLLIATALISIARPAPRDVSPLWLSTVLLLPWVPLRLPLAVFIWTGHLAEWVWITIGAMLLVSHRRHTLDLLRQLSAGGPRRAAVLAGFLSLAAYTFGVWATAPQHPNGDEPHYLIITQSLLSDHDLQIENNHLQRDYRAYSTTSLKPDYRSRGKNGAIYSIHAPGLPLLLVPFFAAFGYRGVIAALVAGSALASALAWVVAWRVTRSHTASWFAWAAVSLSVPYFFLAGSVFPDGPGAALTLAAVLPLVDPRAREPRQLGPIGAALAVLPWLHSRFVILALCGAAAVVGRLLNEPDRVRRIAAFVVCPLASAIAWFAFFQIIYGTPNPSAPYAGTLETAFGNIVRGVPGLLFDQQFGLFVNAPVYVCALLGFAVMLWRGPRRLAAELLLITVPYFLAVSCFYMWWGGTSAPARFLVPIALVLAVPTAVWFASASSSATARAFGAFALFLSVLTTSTIAWVDRGALLLNHRNGASRLALWLAPAVDLTKALPSLFQNPPATVVFQTGIWLSAIVVSTAIAFMLGRRIRAVVALGLALELTTTAAVSLVWRSNHVNAAAPAPGGSAVLRQYDPFSGQFALAYRPFHRVPIQNMLGQIPLTNLSSLGRDEWSMMTHLPPGIYEVTGAVRGAGAGRVRVLTDQQSPAIADWDVASLDPFWRRQVSIPVGVASLEIDLDETAQQSVRDVVVRAASVLPRRDRLNDDREAGHGARYGHAVVFLLSGTAWVEPGGIWIGRAASADVVITPDARTPIRVLVRNGATENQVTLESGTWHQTLVLKPSEEHLCDVPVGDGPGTPLTVRSAEGFRPADVDPKSEDDRLLGVWIETL